MAHLHLLSSDFLHLSSSPSLIFSLLTFSTSEFRPGCFPSVHIVGSLASKLLSIFCRCEIKMYTYLAHSNVPSKQGWRFTNGHCSWCMRKSSLLGGSGMDARLCLRPQVLRWVVFDFRPSLDIIFNFRPGQSASAHHLGVAARATTVMSCILPPCHLRQIRWAETSW